VREWLDDLGQPATTIRADGRVLRIGRLGLDIDTPSDLIALRRAKRRAGARTRAALG